MKAYELLESSDWCQGAFARDRHGDAIAVYASAPSFCILGALIACHRDQVVRLEMLSKHVGGSITLWNDAPERTKNEVVAKLRELDL